MQIKTRGARYYHFFLANTFERIKYNFSMVEELQVFSVRCSADPLQPSAVLNGKEEQPA